MAQPVSMLNDEDCWKAVEDRDASRAGQFYFGVVTTGVYCRPGCASRLPLRRNVRFYASTAAAENDGLRPCKRCRPLDTGYDPAAESIRELCRYIDSRPDAAPDLAELAARACMSRFHLQRTFKAVTGVTPREYAEAARIRRLKGSLRRAQDVTEAGYDAGFGSSSRVYERADTRLGMTPRQYRRGGEGVAITYASAQKPLGVLMIGATDRGICFVQFGDSEEELSAELRREYPAAQIMAMTAPDRPDFDRWM